MDKKIPDVMACSEIDEELDELLGQELRPEDMAVPFEPSEEDFELLRRWALAQGWDEDKPE